MKLRELLHRALHPRRTPAAADPDHRPANGHDRAQASAWLAAWESGRLNPPHDPHDAAAWDTYWKNHLEFGPMEQALSDMMSSDSGLPDLLVSRGATTVLCAGNGLSTEALALALLGFHVTAFDISEVPAHVLGQMLRSETHPLRQIPGFSLGSDGIVSFGRSGPIDPELCPPIHRSANRVPQGGGSLSLVTGDLTRGDICPGPFDAVIERRTVQLFPAAERIPAYERLAARLARRGLFVSHEHQGGWRPGQSRTHHAEAWLTSHGFVLRHMSQADPQDAAERLAYLMFSSG
jgi:hypothetical protein